MEVGGYYAVCFLIGFTAVWTLTIFYKYFSRGFPHFGLGYFFNMNLK